MNPGELRFETDLDSIHPLPESATNLAPQSPGAMLKRAREAMKLTQQQVADKLKLTLDRVVQIERDDFSRTTAFIYIRGYLKTYAKLVNLPEEKILAAFDSLGLLEPDRQKLMNHTKAPIEKQKHSLSFSKQHKKLSLKIAAAVIVLLALIVVFNWWHNKLSPGTEQTANLIKPDNNPNAIALQPVSEASTSPVNTNKSTLISAPPSTLASIPASAPASTLAPATQSTNPPSKNIKHKTNNKPAIVNEKIYYHTASPNED